MVEVMDYCEKKEAMEGFKRYLSERRSSRDKPPICSLQGSPGAGKTRFLKEFAKQCTKEFMPVMVTFNSQMPFHRSELVDPVSALANRMIAV